VNAAKRTSAGVATIVGARGGIGSALADLVEQSGRYSKVVRLSRGVEPHIDIEDEVTIRQAADHIASLGVPTLVLDATGFLHGGGFEPEKNLAQPRSRSSCKVVCRERDRACAADEAFPPFASERRSLCFRDHLGQSR
jgi:hypothetical protein